MAGLMPGAVSGWLGVRSGGVGGGVGAQGARGFQGFRGFQGSQGAQGASASSTDIRIHEAFLLGTGDVPKFLQSFNVGGGVNLEAGTEPLHQGIISLFCTAPGDVVGVRSTLSKRTFLIPAAADGSWAFKWIFKIPTLSVAADRFTLTFGVADDVPGFITRQVTMVYSDNINAGNFTLRTQDGGGTTNVDSTVAAVANTWYYVELFCTLSGIDLYIDTVWGSRTFRVSTAANIPADALAIMGAIDQVTLASPAIDIKLDDFCGEFNYV